jgi:cobalt/nickel transport system permease protein
MRSLGAGLLDIGALDSLAAQETAVHRLDPRAKLVAAALFLVAVVSFGRYEVAGLAPLAAFPLFLCAAGRVPFGFVAKKLLVAAPFALLLGAANPFFDTAPRAVIAGAEISGGWLSFASLALRLALTVSAAVSLVAVTGLNPLCDAASRLGAPRILTAQLALLYRYLFVLSAEAGRTARAADLRAPGRRRTLALAGPMLGTLALRALDRGERVHAAMRCRGFTGAVPRLSSARFGIGDAAFVSIWAAFFAGAVLLGALR